MNNSKDIFIDFIGRHYIGICAFYFIVLTGLGFFEALRKHKEKEVEISEKRYNQLFILGTVPLLFPLIFGMYGFVLFVPIYLTFEYINTEPSEAFIFAVILLWLITNFYLSIKAYRAIYTAYKNKNGAI